jgi:hypothetical protein
MLCDSCRTLLSDILTSDPNPSRWTPIAFPPSNFFSAVHGDFGRSASCRVCHFVCKRIPKSDATSINLEVYPLWTILSDGNYYRAASFNVVKTFDLGRQTEQMEFFVSEGGPTEWPCEESKEQRTFDDLDVVLQPKLLPRLGRATGRYSGSDAVLNLASYWSSRCSQGHQLCEQRRYEQPLPNRVINVGNALDESLRLMESHGERGFYATLSHRCKKSILYHEVQYLTALVSH